MWSFDTASKQYPTRRRRMPDFQDGILSAATMTAPTTSATTANSLDVDWGDQDAMSATPGLERLQPAGKTPQVRVAQVGDEFRLRGTTRQMLAHGVPLDRIS